jgi:tRNA-specific 2-thiouridylase
MQQYRSNHMCTGVGFSTASTPQSCTCAPFTSVPRYVVRKDCDLNLLYVSRQYHEASRSRSAFNAGPFSWLSPLRPQTGPDAPPLYCKVRHGPHAYRCELRVVQAEAGVQQSQPAAGPTSVTAAGEAPVGAGATKGSTHGGPAIEVQVWDPTESKALVVLDGNDQGLAAGQWAVFYQGGVCLGAAVIQGPPAGLVAPFSGAGARGRHVTLTAAGESEA